MGKAINLPTLAPRGAKMPSGKGWRLVTPSKNRWFKSALLKTVNVNGERLAIFRVVR